MNESSRHLLIAVLSLLPPIFTDQTESNHCQSKCSNDYSQNCRPWKLIGFRLRIRIVPLDGCRAAAVASLIVKENY